MSDSCIGCPMHLSVCKAECCEEFRVSVSPRMPLKRGDVLRLRNVDEDFELYCNLREFKSDKDYIYIVLDRFRRFGKYLYVYKRCSLLTEDLLCRGHSGEVERPRICDYPNIKDGAGGESIYITSNCLYEVNGGIKEKWKKQMSQ